MTGGRTVSIFSQFVIVVLPEDNEVLSSEFKTQNRDSTLDHCVEP
jgi:hypothetical protein